MAKVNAVTLDNWDGIIEDVHLLSEKIESFADRIDSAEDIEEFYLITNNLFRLISMANRTSLRAVNEAERLHKSTTSLMATTLTFGEA